MANGGYGCFREGKQSELSVHVFALHKKLLIESGPEVACICTADGDQSMRDNSENFINYN